MKKSLLIFLPALALGTMVLTESMSAKHLVLHEKFTNTGCAPCARFAPASDSLLNMRLGDVVALTYHGFYPKPDDEFYLQNKDAADQRIALYDVTGYPSVFLNGSQILHSVAAIDQRIDQLLKDEQVMDMAIATELKEGKLNVKVTATPLKALNNPNLRLFVAAVEETVVLPKPAPNMQIEFNHEFRHFMHDAAGYDMGAFESLSPATFENEWTVEGFANVDELGVVAWIQDMQTKEVIEACYAPKSTDLTEAAKVLLVEDTPSAICSPHYSAKVYFRNLGNKPLTSCNICVSINGTVQKTPWTGNLGYLESEIFVTPDFTDFTFDENATSNVTNIFISDLNGTDEVSNYYSLNFTNSVVGQNSVELALFTDNKPEETSWELYDSDNNLLESSEPFTEKRKFYRRVFDLSKDDCYRIKFTDKGGDGIIGDYGNGYYKLTQKTTDGKSKMIAQGDFGGAEHTVFFRLANATSGLTDAVATAFTFSADKSTLSIPCAGSLTVADASGRVVMAREVQPGEISLDSLTPGVYVLRLDTGSEPYYKTILVSGH